MRRAGKSDYYTDDSLSTVVALCECVELTGNISPIVASSANEQLFHSIKYKPTHPLRPFLPPERSTPYCTRPRPHNYELSSKISNIDDYNFMYHVLYKDCF